MFTSIFGFLNNTKKEKEKRCHVAAKEHAICLADISSGSGLADISSGPY
jgi:hypothetical protein